MYSYISFSCLFNSAPMGETTPCFECGKTYSLKLEKDRKIKEKLHKKLCSNEKIVTFKYKYVSKWIYIMIIENVL